MEQKHIKNINISLSENLEFSNEKPNYKHIVFDDLNIENKHDDITNIIKLSIQNVFNYEIVYNLECENKRIILKINDLDIIININYSYISSDIFNYNYKRPQKLSNIKILENIYKLHKDHLQIKEQNEKINKQILKLDKDFEYYYKSDNYIVLKYIKYNIMFKVSFDFEFISYLEHEGETYSNGSEEITTNDILDRIKYYTNIYKSIDIIKEKLKLLK